MTGVSSTLLSVHLRPPECLTPGALPVLQTLAVLLHEVRPPAGLLALLHRLAGLLGDGGGDGPGGPAGGGDCGLVRVLGQLATIVARVAREVGGCRGRGHCQGPAGPAHSTLRAQSYWGGSGRPLTGGGGGVAVARPEGGGVCVIGVDVGRGTAPAPLVSHVDWPGAGLGQDCGDSDRHWAEVTSHLTSPRPGRCSLQSEPTGGLPRLATAPSLALTRTILYSVL